MTSPLRPISEQAGRMHEIIDETHDRVGLIRLGGHPQDSTEVLYLDSETWDLVHMALHLVQAATTQTPIDEDKKQFGVDMALAYIVSHIDCGCNGSIEAAQVKKAIFDLYVRLSSYSEFNN